MPDINPTHVYDVLLPSSLRLVSDSLDDVEALRKATANRYRQATEPWVDEETGETHRRDERDPLVASVAALDEALRDQEHRITLQLQREIRHTVFGTWLKQQPGVGEKTLARLLAATGDPYLRVAVDQHSVLTQTPRTVGQLWAYSGLAVDDGRARRVRKGAGQAEVFACGKPQAKMRAYLIAECLVKAGVRTIDKDLAPAEDGAYPLENKTAISGYGQAYLDRRRVTAQRFHAADCVRCGPSGHPAKAGTPWSSGHQQADALRILSKQVLRDLWLLAREHHTGIPADAPAGQGILTAAA